MFLGLGLKHDPREVPSPLIGKPAPAFNLPTLADAQRSLRKEDMLGKVWLLNVWASWCASCRDEHPVLIELAKSGKVPIYGLNYKDKRPDGIAWLNRFGDPYVLSAYDVQGRIGIDYGVYGVPETYVIDKQGFIRYKQIGPLDPDTIEKKIIPLVKQLELQ